jgi:CheY-like chemotaxis protein
MKKKILWIEDDYFSIKSLFSSLEKVGYTIDAAQSALEGYRKLSRWRDYDLIVIDLILPLTINDESIPDSIVSWKREKYAGVPLAKWLKGQIKDEKPLIILSVISENGTTDTPESLGLTGYISISKRGLLPSELKEKILNILNKQGV